MQTVSCACAVPRIPITFPSRIIKWMILDTGQQLQNVKCSRNMRDRWRGRRGFRVKEARVYCSELSIVPVSSFRPPFPLSLHSPSGPEPRGALRAGGDPAQKRSAASWDPETERGAERSHYRGGGAGDQHRGQVRLTFIPLMLLGIETYKNVW